TELAISFRDLVVSHDSQDRYYEVIQTSRGYFRLLHEYSRGNPAVAQFFWLQSLRMDHHKQLQVDLFTQPSDGFFDKVDEQYLFALAAIAQHGELTVEEVAHVIDIDYGFCATAINYLREKDIVYVHPRTRKVRIQIEYFRLVMRKL